MDPIPLIIGVVVFFIVISVIFSVIKGIMKILLLIFTVLAIVLVIGGFFVIIDFKEFREKFPTEEKTIILEDEGNILTGFTMTTEDEEPLFLTQEQVDSFSGYLKADKLDAIQGNSYKLMIIDLDIFEEMSTDILEIGPQEFTKEFVVSVLRSDDAVSLMEDTDMDLFFRDDITIKAAMFVTVFNEITKNPLFFFSQYKEENILVYPETAIFKAIKFLPIGLVEGAMEGMISKVEEKIPFQRGA